jgi:Trk-type K+ transport system membrane component
MTAFLIPPPVPVGKDQDPIIISLAFTPSLSNISKILLSMVVLIGRIGILSLGLAYMSSFTRKETESSHDIAI